MNSTALTISTIFKILAVSWDTRHRTVHCIFRMLSFTFRIFLDRNQQVSHNRSCGKRKSCHKLSSIGPVPKY